MCAPFCLSLPSLSHALLIFSRLVHRSKHFPTFLVLQTAARSVKEKFSLYLSCGTAPPCLLRSPSIGPQQGTTSTALASALMQSARHQGLQPLSLVFLWALEQTPGPLRNWRLTGVCWRQKETWRERWTHPAWPGCPRPDGSGADGRQRAVFSGKTLDKRNSNDVDELTIDAAWSWGSPVYTVVRIDEFVCAFIFFPCGQDRSPGRQPRCICIFQVASSPLQCTLVAARDMSSFLLFGFCCIDFWFTYVLLALGNGWIRTEPNVPFSPFEN
jgi:hypothetical protein